MEREFGRKYAYRGASAWENESSPLGAQTPSRALTAPLQHEQRGLK